MVYTAGSHTVSGGLALADVQRGGQDEQRKGTKERWENSHAGDVKVKSTTPLQERTTIPGIRKQKTEKLKAEVFGG